MDVTIELRKLRKKDYIKIQNVLMEVIEDNEASELNIVKISSRGKR